MAAVPLRAKLGRRVFNHVVFYPDLGTETYADRGPHVRAVGWLSSGHPFPKGTAPPGVVSKLRVVRKTWHHCREALHWGFACGLHPCEFCHKVHDNANIGIPDGPILYAAPGMLWHYVRTHRYLPPQQFLDALIRSPMPGTFEYFVATAPFNGQLRSKTPAIQHLVATLRTTLPDRICPWDVPETGAESVWVNDCNGRDPQRRLLVRLTANPTIFDIERGASPRGKPGLYVAECHIGEVTLQELLDFIRIQFSLPEPRDIRYSLLGRRPGSSAS